MSTMTLDQEIATVTTARVVPQPSISYQLQWRRCGRRTCRCYKDREDLNTRHGPYWYAYWRDPVTGKLRSRYVGKVRTAIQVDQNQGAPTA
ncbi:MAG: hypothetical protein H0W02_10255 [Ktedonobacteraceae bacterium]|nr:hypothetical protein [Ktedonobacteraceae bacterium]